jgi:predicted esterase
MSKSELEMFYGNKVLIVSFGGMGLQMGGIPPFEFLNYLSKIYKEQCDLLFYIDIFRSCYHKGIDGISSTIKETVIYLNNKIQNKYEKVIFMGISAGAYAAILFGSLCNNITHVIGFMPKTILDNPFDIKYKNIKNFINKTTHYTIIGDTSIQDITDCHHIRQCENLQDFQNVEIHREKYIDMKEMRDNNYIKKRIDDIIYNNIDEKKMI